MTKLKIGKTNYKINVVEAFYNEVIVAEIDYHTKTITVAKKGGITRTPLTQTEIEESFWHEVVHGILKDMGHNLESNEEFVDGVAVRLYKIIKQVHPNARNLVAKRTKGIRTVRKKVSRYTGPKAVPLRKG